MAPTHNHSFCPVTEFCTVCGVALRDYIDTSVACDEVGNVIGISHIIALNKLNKLVNKLLPATVSSGVTA